MISIKDVCILITMLIFFYYLSFLLQFTNTKTVLSIVQRTNFTEFFEVTQICIYFFHQNRAI